MSVQDRIRDQCTTQREHIWRLGFCYDVQQPPPIFTATCGRYPLRVRFQMEVVGDPCFARGFRVLQSVAFPDRPPSCSTDLTSQETPATIYLILPSLQRRTFQLPVPEPHSPSSTSYTPQGPSTCISCLGIVLEYTAPCV